ncbi:MAG: hypothetical protein Q8918_09420 [Bacteroidota bacterium]|nr:hypothetical protein [Bacteroidota bacterium]MDP4213680.1 hypothetical protein [Bacteroidota bacterium]MDP4250310.1 hypothetical protein [Bacteroidota bacterium]
MKKIIRFSIFSFFLLPALMVQAQMARPPFKIQQERKLWHDNIDREQKRLLALDGKADSIIQVSKDENVNLQVADAMIRQVDELQEKIELDSTLNGQMKIKNLRSLETMLKGFNNHYRQRDFPSSMAPALFEAFTRAMELDRANKSIEPVIAANIYGIGKILVDCFLLPTENVGVKNSRNVLISKYCELHPDQIFTILSSNPSLPNADSLIIIGGRHNIRKLYDYASGNTALSSRIRNSTDSLTIMVAKIAASRSGQLYLPFLDDLIHHRITITEINNVKDDNLNYYRLLVKTRLNYVDRMLPPLYDTALEMEALTTMLENKGKDVFVREINALHDKPASVRFKILDQLSPAELYYLVVLSEDEIYTSSYLGVYDRIFQRMQVPRGDSLILQMHGDYFRKFIKMAAAYNKLDHFLATMDKDNAATIMKAFIIGLERANEEDAVDVADSYSSIFDKNPPLAAFVLNEVKWNYKRNLLNNDKRGIVIYHLMEALFESADTTNQEDLSAKLGIAPVYSISYDSLKDDSGRVIQQVFFYGDEDKDGQHSYDDFLRLFLHKPEWKITMNPTKEWVTIQSVKGKPIWIFANRPLFGEDDPDDKAQHHLDDYLYDNKLKPTIYIHRGHSYHVRYTLQQIQPSAKIVVLGSCGGYNNLSEVLNISSDAHIISSKQVGTKSVNEPILQAINDDLLGGNNIDWLPMWKELTEKFRKDPVARERFDDYIPPYKNLGAIFIKAYRKAMGEED